MAKGKPSPRDGKMPGDTFTDTHRVRDLVALMAQHDLTEIELVERDSRIKLKRADPFRSLGTAPAAAPAPAQAAAPAPIAGGSAPESADLEKFVTVRSPMVGTFYSAANPDSDAYVTIGSQVNEETVVCIIEAMKVFNEIRAEAAGTVAKILVQNGQAVEFNQPLYLLKP